jgi:Uma2 family endonuclease
MGEGGYLKLFPGQVRAPDVPFIDWQHFPERKSPKAAIYAVAPDLAVEVLSESNTAAEMNRKLRDYFTVSASIYGASTYRQHPPVFQSFKST